MSDGSTTLSTRNEATDLVNFKILLNKQEMSGEYRVTSLFTAKVFNKISMAKITLVDGDPAAQDFPISSKEEALAPGSEVEISMGYHARTKTIFKGIIVSHAIKSGKNKQSLLTIEAKHQAVKLSIGRNSHCFVDKSDSEIMEGIMKGAGFDAKSMEVASTGVKHKEMVQYNATDWDFILSRAEMNGMFILTDDQALLIKKPDINQEATKEITYGMDVIDFESEVNAPTQLKQIRSHAWNYKDQQVEVSPDASLPFKENGNLKADQLADAMGVKTYGLFHPGNLSSDELKSWSNARLMKSRLAKTSGRITIKGTTEIKPGQVIKLKGFSKRFNGNVLVTGIQHHYDKAIWETDVQYGLSDQWFYQREDVIEKPASGLVPGINGLQIGIVTQLENDPDQQDRIKIQLPMVDQHEGIWARMASLDAGKERGAYFRPEIQDEVVVGFLNDDPRHAIILGMLHSSAKPAPNPAKDTNHEKGFVTRSQIKLSFNDEKKSVSLETPKGKKIELSDDSDTIVVSDQHQNKITIGAQGVVIESAKDISLKATSGQIKLEAMNIENKATAKFSAEGNATATLQSSGQTVVKGSLVNIN